jgi:hypothetical protein
MTKVWTMSDDFDDFGEPDDDAIVAREDELTPVPYACAACGEINRTMLDPGGGLVQVYTEDCEVCCRPNLLRISIDPESRIVAIENELEYE